MITKSHEHPWSHFFIDINLFSVPFRSAGILFVMLTKSHEHQVIVDINRGSDPFRSVPSRWYLICDD